MQGHKNLLVWQKAMDLVIEIYRLNWSFPKLETYLTLSGWGAPVGPAAASNPKS